MIIHGRGFVDNGNETPRCRFGTPYNYVIVDADILSYNRMACRTPEGLVAQKPAQWPADIPFSVALNSDTYEPWTQTSTKFRFYKQPSISRLEPEKIAVGSIREVLVHIDDDPDQPENLFFEPMPVMKRQQKEDDEEEEEDSTYLATMGAFN